MYIFPLCLQKSSLNLRESSSSASGKDKDRLSLNTDNKYTHTNAAGSGTGAGAGAGTGSSGPPQSAPPTGGKRIPQLIEREERDKDSGNEKDANGALQQCITELAASIKAQPDNGAAQGGGGGGDADRESTKVPLRKSTSQYVTVIQVKEAKDKEGDDTATSSVNDQQQQQPTPPSTFARYAGGGGNGGEPSAPPLSPSLTSYAAHVEAKKKMPPR